MPSLKDLKNRISSVKSTRKITSAMKMVAAAKLRRAQDAAEAARPYSERMEAVLANLASAASASPTAPKLLTGNGRSQTYLLVVATAERGLCGGFNSSIARLARSRAHALKAEGREVKILTVGRKGREQLARDFAEAMVDHVDLSETGASYAAADAIAGKLIALFAEQKFDVAEVFYNRFVSVISQEPTARQIIPAAPGDVGEAASASPYEYEPSEEAILAELLPSALASQVFRALLENAASEQGARMAAMDSATRNAGEMIDKLTLVYNRTRQAAITKELIEIISGAEAL